jgi:glycosyltransferase involved in cell wall biosynthesis
VLHTHRYKENVIGSAVRLMRHSMRTLRTVHGSPEFSPKGLALKRRLQRFVDRMCARFVQWPVVSVSHPLAEQFRRIVPPSRVRVVENGLLVADTERRAATPVTLQPDGRRVRIGFFGRLVTVKRVDVILRVARLLETQAPGVHAIYVFGEGPLRAELEAEAHRLGISAAVRFMGFTEEVAANLKAMDFLLLTSDHEGLPMIVLEAMALGVPVVSHAVGAIPALLEEGRAGTLLTTQSPEAFARAITELLGDQVATAERTARARHRLVTRYSADRAAAEYAAIYREMLGERPLD